MTNVHGTKYFNKVYGTVQELGIQAFMEQSSTKFIDLFINNMELTIIFPECSAFSNLKNLKSFCEKKNAFDCAGIRAQVFGLMSDISFSTGRSPYIA